MSNSNLICHTNISPNKSSPRKAKIDTITIHCMAGDLSVESCGNIFANSSRNASSNYGVGSDGRIALYVDEGDRTWCTSSSSNDHRAITIEVASDNYHPYAVTDKALNATIELCADICKRNGITELKWLADKSLIGQVDKQNMTVHRWFANKACPGDYLYNLHGDIAKKVNEILAPVESEVEELRYNKLSEMPDYAVSTVKKMMDLGMLKGSGKTFDEYGYPADVDLSIDMIRVFVVHDQAGIYG